MVEYPEHVHGADLTFDIESNGLLEDKRTYSKSKGLEIAPAADRIWMSCHRDAKTGWCYDFIDDKILKTFRRAILRHNRQYGREKVMLLPLSEMPRFWDITGRLTGHNSVKFDFPLVGKIMGYYLDRNRMWDTLIQSQTQNCDREYVSGSTSGPHSVESWALRINKGGKVEHEDWMNFSIDMYKRCWRDVEVQCDIGIALEDEREIDRLECNINWDSALHTEHMAAYWISWSEKWGFPCDIPHTTNLVETLDVRLAEIENELLPSMPFRLTMQSRCGTLRNWEDYSQLMLNRTGLTHIPLGWCWPEDGGNKPQPVWEPFKADGDYIDSVRTFWEGKDPQPFIPAEPERIAVKTVKAKKAKYNKDNELISEEVIAVKGVRARKAQPAVEAKPRVPNCYEDEAGFTDPPIHRCKLEDVQGPFTRIQWVNYSLGSNAQVLEYLMRYTSWEHTEVTDNGNPKLTEDSFDSIGQDGIGETLKEYLIRKSRRTNIKNFKDPSKGWLNLLREDGRITPINHTMGTPTARSRHANLVNVPSGGALCGNEMRDCWVAYDGGLMFGIDSSGLEMRMLANEMGDEQCTNEIVEGDIHTVIWELIPDFSDSRGNTKGIEYCLIYGGSDGKLGSLANVDGCREHFASEDKLYKRGWERDGDLWRHTRWSHHKESLSFKAAQDTVCGSIIRDRIMKGLKPLGDCIERITAQAEKGFLVGLDGRKLIVRSTHSALNLKLQSTGAILMKASLVKCMEKLEEVGLVKIDNDYEPNKFVELFTFYHDELQLGIPKSCVKEEKILQLDLSGFNLKDKAEKKEAKGKLEAAASRFKKRQRRSLNKCWSGAKIDLEAGTATLLYSDIGQICVEVFEEMGDVYNINCPVTGDFDIGRSWKETH